MHYITTSFWNNIFGGVLVYHGLVHFHFGNVIVCLRSLNVYFTVYISQIVSPVIVLVGEWAGYLGQGCIIGMIISEFILVSFWGDLGILC